MKERIVLTFFLISSFILFLILSSCNTPYFNPKTGSSVLINNSIFCGYSTYGSCLTDNQCIRGGCSGQVCQSIKEKPIATTCEYRDCYDSKKYKVSCRCVNNKCQWVGQ